MNGVRVQKNSFETSLFVVYPPKSMCKEIPDYYTSEVDGREVKRPRYVARDYEEAKKYPEESMRWLAENFIPGGIDAVAGGDMNFDESTPHIQFQADTLSPPPSGQARYAALPPWHRVQHRPHGAVQRRPEEGQADIGPTEVHRCTARAS